MAKRYTKDYKKIRMLNFLYENRPTWIIKYSLFNLPRLTAQSWGGGAQILNSLCDHELAMKGILCRPYEPGCIRGANCFRSGVPIIGNIMVVKTTPKNAETYYTISQRGIDTIEVLKELWTNRSISLDLFEAFEEITDF